MGALVATPSVGSLLAGAAVEVVGVEGEREMRGVVERGGVSVSKVALRRSLCRESYQEFVREFWSELIPEEPIWNWHIRFLADEIQRVCERVFRREPKEYDLVINVPPGTTKSTLCSVMLLPWIWTRMPECRFLGGSYNAELSLEFGNKARRLIKGLLYRETFPEVVIDTTQDTKGYFSNTRNGERVATSTGASIVGRHFHIHSIDDPINPTGARSDIVLRETNLWLSEAVAQRCVSLSLTPLILVMQRLAVDDPTGVRLSKKGGFPVRHICLPAELTEEVKPAVLKNKYKDGLLEPIRLSRKVLEVKRAEGEYFYAGQFLQSPVPLTGGLFKVERLQGPKALPEPKLLSSVIRWWDKAATAGGGAYTAGVLLGMMRDERARPRWWVLDVVRSRVGSHERERLIRMTTEQDAEVWGKTYRVGLEQEPGSGGKDSLLATIQNLEGFTVVTERATGSKLLRAEPFATQVNGENVAYCLGDWNQAYIEELRFFGETAKYKDQVDASSGAFNYLSRRRLKLGSGGF